MSQKNKLKIYLIQFYFVVKSLDKWFSTFFLKSLALLANYKQSVAYLLNFEKLNRKKALKNRHSFDVVFANQKKKKKETKVLNIKRISQKSLKTIYHIKKKYILKHSENSHWHRMNDQNNKIITNIVRMVKILK